MKKVNYNYKDRIEKFLFETNWIEIPLYFNNFGKTIRFDVESKPESEKVELIKTVFNDLFHENGNLFVIFYGSTNCNWRAGKKYFKRFSLKKITRKKYSSRDEDPADENYYIVACLVRKRAFKFYKFISDYLEDDQKCQLAFANLRNGSAVQFYDCRGFDLFSEDKDFLKELYYKHEKHILEFNRKEIFESLDLNEL